MDSLGCNLAAMLMVVQYICEKREYKRKTYLSPTDLTVLATFSGMDCSESGFILDAALSVKD